MRINSKKIKLAFSIVSILTLSVIGIKNKSGLPLKADNNNEVLYTEDFSGNNGDIATGFGGAVTIRDGKGVYNATQTWMPMPIDTEKLYKSNNYEVSFDIKYSSSQDLFFHLVHLDGTGVDKNIYFNVIAGGQYLKFADYDGYDIYDNSGEDQGCNFQDFKAKLNNEGVNFKFILLNDVIEFWCSGKRYISVPLSSFGNNRYNKGRHNITKGIIDGFAFDCRGEAESLELDNIIVKEAEGKQTYYKNTEVIEDSFKMLPLTYENLYQPNFRISSTFEVQRALVENSENHGYPKFKLLMNYPEPVLTNPENYLNVQAYLDREFVTPWIGGLKDNGEWGSFGTDCLAAKDDESTQFTLTLEVIGDKLKFVCDTNGSNIENNHREATTTFTDLGLRKGALLGIAIQNEYTKCINVEYIGFSGTKEIKASIDKTTITAGNEITATAEKLGDVEDTDFAWYIDGVKTENTGLVLKHVFNDAGSHTIVYKGSTETSNELNIEVVGRIINITSDVNELYCDESVTITATKQGEFTEDIVWYINEEQTENTGDELILRNLQPETTYTIKASAHGIFSNELNINIKKSAIVIEAEKGSYDKNETAILVANTFGIKDDDTISWYLDGEVAGTGKEFSLDLSEKNGGEEIKVKVKSKSGIESEEMLISVIYDIKQKNESNEYWNSIYEQKITTESEAFGQYELVVPETGNPYYRATTNQSNDADFPGISVVSSSWAMDYDLLIPADISGEYYVYPQLLGVDTKYPNDRVEMAIAINNEKIRTYIKFHDRGINLEEETYGVGSDLSYTGSIVKKGDWNHITVAVDGTYIAFYVNDTMTFFGNVSNTTVPSGACMSTWLGSSQISPSVTGYKNFKISAVIEPAPSVSSVNISASKISCAINEQITLTASVTPYNAEPSTIEWYVNDAIINNATSLSYVFVPTQTGTYNIVCKIDGVESSAKTITVNANQESNNGEEHKKGCNGAINYGLGSIVVLFGALFIILRRKY